MSQTTYTIEHAKSGRSGCKKCKEKIGKGELRIGVAVEGGEFTMQSWYHPACYNVPRKLVSSGTTPESFVRDLLEDKTTDNMLNDEDKVEQLIRDIASKPVKKKSSDAGAGGLGGGGGGAKERMDKIKSLAKRMDREYEEEPKKKKLKKGETDEEDELKLAAQAYGFYEKHKNDELKDVLRYNQQMVSGSKDILLLRILDGHVHGRLGFCPTCNQGKVKLNDDGTSALCNGYFDEDLGRRVPCFFTCKVVDAPRFHPWYTRKPTEDEQKEMDALQESRKTGGEDAVDVSSIPSELTKAASDLEWDLSSPPGVKKAASAMLKLCTSSNPTSTAIDLPDDPSRAKMEVGKIIAMNKSRNATEILTLIVDKFGLKSVKADKAKKKRDAMTSICANPANAPIMVVIAELSDLYFKESNTNAGISYRKVAEAIKNIQFEITKNNAKGLGKGKTKVQGIGKSSAEKIYEFVSTGTIEKLEEKRAAALS